MAKRRGPYGIVVEPKPHLGPPVALDPYCWLWTARLRVRHFLSDDLLRAGTVKVTISDQSGPVETYRPHIGGFTVTPAPEFVKES